MEPNRRPVERRPWTTPEVVAMPPLKELTLQTGFADTSAPGGFSF
jgi:hypothetical protein